MTKIILLLWSLVVAAPAISDEKEGICKIPIPETMASYMREINDLNVNTKKLVITKVNYCKINYYSLKKIEKLLNQYQDTLNKDVINTVLATIKCRNTLGKQYNNILTIIDYSLPSNKKRIWIFDLREKKLLFHTYVSHGITSGALATEFFSDKNGSKASSFGVYMTEKPYYGRHGLSLRLQGLDEGFNHHANQRNIVMHAAWYVNEDFKNKYGRVGRSWGCPAVPLELIKPIINTIKERSLFVAYYPSKQWFLKSKFLNCRKLSLRQFANSLRSIPTIAVDELRGDIIFADRNKNNKREENEPIVVMATDDYQKTFNTNVPLARMLRRQMNNNEYIALNHKELQSLDTNRDNTVNDLDDYNLQKLDLVVAVVRKDRGYYITEFKSVDVGKIKEIQSVQSTAVLIAEKSNIDLRLATGFIRWLGL